MDFERAIEFVLRAEGGYVDDGRDPGGSTNWGISQRAYPNIDIRALTKDDAKDLYRRHYWNEIKGDSLPDPWGMLLLDDSVNRGIPRAVKTLQKALGVAADGVVGPQTIAALARVPARFQNAYFAERVIAYTQTANFDVFGRGWVRRVFDLASEVR